MNRILLLALLVAVSVDGDSESTRTLVRFPATKIPIKDWMKQNGWEKQRGNPRRFQVGEGRLLMVSKKDSVAIGTRRGFPLDPKKWPRIRMRFNVEELPRGTDLSRKSGDDSAFRVLVSFDRGKGMVSPPHTIAYAWTEAEKIGTLIRSAHFKQLRYLTIGKGLPEKKDGEAPAWITIERNLLEDYRFAFPEDTKPIPNLVSILLKCDSNNTKTSARASVQSIELLPPRKP